MDHRLRYRLGAPVIRPSYRLNKLLTGLARQHQTRERLTDEELQGWDLTDAERSALRTGDVTALYLLGANPYLIRRVFRPRFPV